MIRLLLASVVAVTACSSGAPAQTLTERIDSLRMTDGHLPSAYLQNPKASGLRWYFSNLGVHAIALDKNHDKEVREYLDRYLGTATLPGGAIDDVRDLTKPEIAWQVSDSDDSYAGTILSLACWYSNRLGGEAWFKVNLAQLKFIATANLLSTIDPKTKLICTYNSQPARFKVRGKEVAPYQKICQLMDNCEAYRGLKDFADRLAKLKDEDADKYAKAAETVALGICGLFDRKEKAFRVSTIAAGEVKFYPHRLIQVAPQVYGVDLGADTKIMYDDAWAYLNAGGDKWWEGEIRDKSNQGAPFMILAYAAALRREREKTNSQLSFFQKALERSDTPLEFGAIHELGWALRASRLK